MNKRRTFIPAVALIVAAAGALGATGAFGGSADPGISILNHVPAASVDVDDHVRKGHPRFDFGNAIAAREYEGAEILVSAAEDDPRETCLLRLAPDGSAASTCGDDSVVTEFGGVPLLQFEPSGTVLLTALVPDEVTAAESDDGHSGTVANNVLVIRVGSQAERVELSGSAPAGAIPVGMWRDDE